MTVAVAVAVTKSIVFAAKPEAVAVASRGRDDRARRLIVFRSIGSFANRTQG